jgi:hypothetical protein
LADVIGVSITFQSAGLTGTGGDISTANALSLVLTVQARPAFRGSGAPQVEAINALQPTQVPNTAFVQPYDSIQFDPADLDPGLGPNDPRWGKAGTTAGASVYLTGGTLNVTATKAFNPTALSEPERDQPVTVTLAGASTSTLTTDSAELLDDPGTNQGFWNHLAFREVVSATFPSGADTLELCLYGRFGAPADPATWACATTSLPPGTSPPTLTPDLPAQVTAALAPAVQGVKATFTRSDAGRFGPTWTARLVFTTVLRTQLLDGSGAVEFPEYGTGEVNELQVTSTRTGMDAPVSVKHRATIQWQAGPRILGVNKAAPISQVFPGDSAATAAAFPFRLTVFNDVRENSGGGRKGNPGYITVIHVQDLLPPGVHYLPVPSGAHQGEPYILTVSTPSGATSTLSTQPVFEVDEASSPQTVTFTWPDDGVANRFVPGESVEITIYAWMELGAYGVGENAENTMEVRTGVDLDAAANLDRGRPVVFDYAADRRLVRTMASVTPQPGPNFRLAEGVLGALGTAVNSANPDAECSQTIARPTETTPYYFAVPCVADSYAGGHDEWILHAVNAGTSDVMSATFFVPLPSQGDALVVAGTPRGSTYRPQIVDGSVAVTLLDAAGEPITGADIFVEVSTAPGACAGAWTALVGDPLSVPCAADPPGTWTEMDDVTDWSQVTGVRVTATGIAGALLGPAGTVDITYETVNAPLEVAPDGTDNGGAAIDALVPAEQSAFGQFGVSYIDVDRPTSPQRLAPTQVGVTLRGSAVEVTKTVAGEDAARAPDAFAATATCAFEWADAAGTQRTSPVTFGGEAVGTLPLTTGAGLTARADLLPPGTVCEFSEAGSLGDYDEDARTVSASSVTAAEVLAYTVDDAGTWVLPPVPETQSVTITNTYNVHPAPSQTPSQSATPSASPTPSPSVTPSASPTPAPSQSSPPGAEPVPQGVPTTPVPPTPVPKPTVAEDEDEQEEALPATGLNPAGPRMSVLLLALGIILMIGARKRRTSRS